MSAFESWREEKQSAWLYRRIAGAEKDLHIARLFGQLADEADSQALQWLASQSPGLVAPPFAPGLRARLVAWLADVLGPRRIKPALVALKVRGLSAYGSAAVSGHVMPVNVGEIGRGHRSVGGGNLRAAIFGANDGLISNTSLIVGMVGAAGGAADTGTVLTTGIAGLLAGALSMAAGEFVSVRSQRELFEYQIALERDELAEYPEAEAEELALIYAARGLPIEEARSVARRLVSDPDHALDVLAREELGLNPDDLGSPWGAAGFSFASFTLGALIPLLPFMFGLRLPGAAVAGVLAAALGLFGTGAALSLFTGRSPLWGGTRMLLIGVAAGSVTYAIGSLVGGAIG
jgi:VIT1/CCC1 family predicted Fe2+/Mn2+ transporter